MENNNCSVEIQIFKKFIELKELVSQHELKTQRMLREIETLFVDSYWNKMR